MGLSKPSVPTAQIWVSTYKESCGKHAIYLNKRLKQFTPGENPLKGKYLLSYRPSIQVETITKVMFSVPTNCLCTNSFSPKGRKEYRINQMFMIVICIINLCLRVPKGLVQLVVRVLK